MSFCSSLYKTKKTRKKHWCIFCERTIPVGSPAISWAWGDGDTMERSFSCLPCRWWHKNQRDDEPEITPGERMEEWFADCPECGKSCNVHWNLHGANANIDCQNCGTKFNREYGFAEESEFGCESEWVSDTDPAAKEYKELMK